MTNYVTCDCVTVKQLAYCMFMASDIHITNSEVTNS